MGGGEPIEIAHPDAGWAQEFELLAARVRWALDDLVITVEHVGSTAVPGLAAKAIVDFDAVLASRDDVSAAIVRLAAVGYRHAGDIGLRGREAFDWPPGERRHHLFVVVAGNDVHRRHIVFRDYLRTHPGIAAEYGEFKRYLAARFPFDRDTYTGAKASYIDGVVARARAEEPDGRRELRDSRGRMPVISTGIAGGTEVRGHGRIAHFAR